MSQEDDLDDEIVTRELEKVGLKISSIYDLVNTRRSYPEAIPILIDLLPKLGDNVIKEGVVRALTVKEAKGSAAKPLINEFNRLDPQQELLGWAIANALSVVAENDDFEGIKALILDKTRGHAREMLAFALTKVKNPQAADVLIGLLSDEVMVGHAIAALGKLRERRARALIEQHLDHPKAWVRKEAKRAIAKIDNPTVALRKPSE